MFADVFARLGRIETKLDAIIAWHRADTTKENAMSQALEDKLAQLGAKEDQVVALINTDQSALAALQAANDALKAAQGDDSADVKKVDDLIAKLTPLLPPAAPVTDATGTTPPAATGQGAASA